jgi:hypothetical protein
MQSYDFTGCCGARIFAGWEPGDYRMQTNNVALQGTMEREARAYLNGLKSSNKAVVVTTTSGRQVNANAVLEKLGFYCQESHRKNITGSEGGKEGDTIYVWIMPLNEWENV